MRLEGLGNAIQIPNGAANKAAGGKGDDFASTLMDALKEVNQTQNDAVDTQKAFMAGQPIEYHDLMISMEKADTAMQLTMQVRNKMLDAYQEIERLQV